MSAKGSKSKQGNICPPDLRTVQRWVQQVIMHPEGAESGVNAEEARALIEVDADRLEDVILPSKNLTSLARINIYAQAYYWRLMDIMAQDFPCVEFVVGEEPFKELAREYIAAHPSTNYSLVGFGKHFSAFLAKETEQLQHRSFLVELAILERTMEVVFDCKPVNPLTVDDLLHIPQDRWGETSFSFVPGFELLAFQYPIDGFFQAWRDEKPTPVPDEQASWLAVFQKNYRIWRLRLDEPQFEVLSSLKEGITLGEALEGYAERPDVDVEQVMSSVGGWFNEWTADGLFAKVELKD